MYIYRNDKIIERIPVSKIDSVVFVAPKAPAVPDVPETPVYGAIDLGLPSGVKWATFNVGATKPEEYGGYYAWGEIEEKDDYSWSTYRWCNGSYDSMTKYCTSASFGTVDNKTVLEPEDDVAHVKWGGSWRMPTRAEQDELHYNCTWTWTTINGVNGYEVTGPNGNSIFLPVAAYRIGSDVYYIGNNGNYWSSSLYIDDSYYALELYFNDSGCCPVRDLRYVGGSVRPVCGGTTVPVESYSVSVSTNGNGEVLIEGTQESSVTVSAGASVTVVATPADDYKFIGWYIGESDTPVSTDATYTFTVSANVALVAKFEAEETGDSDSLNGHYYVDLGLPSGLKWATCNVGASSPEEYGGYYAWGEIEEKDSYTEDNSFTYGKYYGDISGNPEYDVACAKWGGAWRMPTKDEILELLKNCTWTWTTRNDVNGYEVTGPNGNSIFLPAAGYRLGTEVYYRGSSGYYWSGSVDYNYDGYAYYLYFDSDNHGVSYGSRFYGYSVRPVYDGATVPVESYTVSVSSNGNGVVSIEGIQENSVTVSAGASVTVVATPDSGYKFIGWYIGESDTPVSTDATYTFIVSANVALVAKFESFVEIVDGHGCVDLGLPSGLKWATCNVGASSPEEYGGYYAWGEIEEKDDYSWSTYKWCNGTDDSMTKYCTSASFGTVDNKTVLEPEDDVAHVKWGGNWRMPTRAEQDELLTKCTWTWTTLNGVNGCEVTGPNGNSIFLPAAGYRIGAEVTDGGSLGIYWSSSLYSNNSTNAYYLVFHDSNYGWNYYNRCFGQSVRPVSE